jgi:diguanylate cyclase (GGDEF)-like protein
VADVEIFTWWAAITVISLLRIVDLAEWLTFSSKHPSRGKIGIFRFGTGAISTALLWSVHTFAFMPTMGVAEFCFTAIVLSSFAGGAVPMLAANKVISLGYSLTLLIPIGIVTLNSEQVYQAQLGYVVILLSLLMIPICLKTSAFTQGAIRQRLLNNQLVIDMAQEKERVAAANRELKATSAELNQSNSILEQEIKKRTDEIIQISNLDPLTQVSNRNAFTQNLDAIIQASEHNKMPVALLFIDLNGFKKINDAMGHKVGDKVLVTVTQRMLAFSETSKVGRWGGDEFLVILPYSDKQTALSISKAIIKSIEKPIEVSGNELHLSASIGIAMSPLHSQSATELIQLADISMCEQKENGVWAPGMFTQALLAKIESSQTILEGLQKAIELKQLSLNYQPIVNSAEHKAESYEALLRWNFNGTLVTPDNFIPLAEKSGLIKEIGAWVLNRACMDAVHWLNSEAASVSVNVSVIQLMDDGFIRHLDNCLQSSRLSPDRLHLEITESTFVENEQKIRFQLDQIQQRRVKISIDDFGTGYSSLSQLQTLPVNFIKIDKSFVDNVHGKGEAIIRATQFIARELNCQTIAEGVETKQQADMLFSMGIDYLQGFYFAKPMPHKALLAWQEPSQQLTKHTD